MDRNPHGLGTATVQMSSKVQISKKSMKKTGQTSCQIEMSKKDMKKDGQNSCQKYYCFNM